MRKLSTCPHISHSSFHRYLKCAWLCRSCFGWVEITSCTVCVFAAWCCMFLLHGIRWVAAWIIWFIAWFHMMVLVRAACLCSTRHLSCSLSLMLAAARTCHARMLIVSHACRFYCSPSILLVVLTINVCYFRTTRMLAAYFVAMYYASLISLSPSCMLIVNTCSPSLMLSVSRAPCLSCSMAFVSLYIMLTVFHACNLCSWFSLAGCNPGAIYVILCSWVHLPSL